MREELGGIDVPYPDSVAARKCFVLGAVPGGVQHEQAVSPLPSWHTSVSGQVTK